MKINRLIRGGIHRNGLKIPHLRKSLLHYFAMNETNRPEVKGKDNIDLGKS